MENAEPVLLAPAPPPPAVAPLPWLIGLRAARANLLPGILVQAAMGAVVFAYYHELWTRPWFDSLANAKLRGGFTFSVVAAMLAGGVVPECLRIVFFQRGRPRLGNLRELGFTLPYWGWSGFTVDVLYRAQNVWFGSGVTLATLGAKVLVDQFLYNPLYAAPAVTLAYEWKKRGYRRQGLGDMFTVRFYAARVVPALIATWGVWLPLVTLIYALPPLLQTPLFSLALTFWVLIVTYITSSSSSAGELAEA